MSSLTDTAVFSKKAFFWIVITISVVIALIVFLGIGKSIKNALIPPKALPATVAFGKIKGVNLSEGFKAPGSVVFNLETISGGFPELPTMAKVFAVSNPDPSFGDLERTKIKADSVGFDGEPVEVSPGVFKFTNNNDSNRTLTIDSVGGNLTLSTDYFNDPEIISTRPESDQTAIGIATNFFEDYGLSLVDYPINKIVTRKLRVDGGKLTETPALSNANLIEVNFYRADFDKVPVLWTKKDEAEISALVSDREIVFAKVNIIPVLKYKFATYPLKTPSLAFEELKKGTGAFNQPITSSQVTIIDISLGYVLGSTISDFIVPAYIFRGVDDFYGYLPAVDDVWFDGPSVRQ